MNIKDLNNKIKERLLEEGRVPENAIKTAEMESEITGNDITNILVRNSFVTHSEVINMKIELDEDVLSNEEVIIPSLDPELLSINKAMINGFTEDILFYSSSIPDSSVLEYAFKTAHFPKHEIRRVSCNTEKLHEYLEKIQAIFFDESSIIERIVRKAIKEQISDIHIVPHQDTYTVLYRYLGIRHPEMMGDKEEYNQMGARIKDLSKMDMSERRKPQDGGFQIDYNGKMVDLRVTTVPTPDGEIIVIRILDPDKAQLDLSGLGITNLKEWNNGASRADGLCLICGPTGSGKTTTLNSTLREQDRFGKAIFTIEDPVEYRIPYIGQVNINVNVGLDFSRAIKSFMRADPDVIVIGEVRDEETARNAIKAAETGHLVFATLHTGSIQSAVNRLRDLGVDAHELKYVLRSVMAQRLMRVVCSSCGGTGEIVKDSNGNDVDVNKDKIQQEDLLATDSEFKHVDFHNKHDCPTCQGNGYSGRTVVSEIKYFAEMNEVLQIIAAGDKELIINWDTMLDDAYNKYKQGITSPGEFLRLFGAEAKKYLIKDGKNVDTINEKGFFE